MDLDAFHQIFYPRHRWAFDDPLAAAFPFLLGYFNTHWKPLGRRRRQRIGIFGNVDGVTAGATAVAAGDPEPRLLRGVQYQPRLEFWDLLQDLLVIPVLELRKNAILGELSQRQFFHVVHNLAAGHRPEVVLVGAIEFGDVGLHPVPMFAELVRVVGLCPIRIH